MMSPVSIFVLVVAVAQCYADYPYAAAGVPFDVYGPPPPALIKDVVLPLVKIPIAPKLEDVPILPRDFTPEIIKPLVHIPTAPKLDLYKETPIVLEHFVPLHTVPTAPKLDLYKETPIVLEHITPLHTIPSAPKLDLYKETPIVLEHITPLHTIPSAPKLDLYKETPIIFEHVEALHPLPTPPKLEIFEHTPIHHEVIEHFPIVPTPPKLDEHVLIHKPIIDFHKEDLRVIPSAPKIESTYTVLTPIIHEDLRPIVPIPTAPKLEHIEITPTIFKPVFEEFEKIPVAPKLEKILVPLHPAIVQEPIIPFVHIPSAPTLDTLKHVPTFTPETHFEDLRNIPHPPKLEESKVNIPILPEIHELLPKVESGPYPPLFPYPAAVPHDVYGLPPKSAGI